MKPDGRYFSKPNTPRTAFSVLRSTLAVRTRRLGLSIFLSAFRLVLPLRVPDLITIHTSLPPNLLGRCRLSVSPNQPSGRLYTHVSLSILLIPSAASVLQPLCGRCTRRVPSSHFHRPVRSSPFGHRTRTSLSTLSTRLKSLSATMVHRLVHACQFDSFSSLVFSFSFEPQSNVVEVIRV